MIHHVEDDSTGRMKLLKFVECPTLKKEIKACICSCKKKNKNKNIRATLWVNLNQENKIYLS